MEAIWRIEVGYLDIPSSPAFILVDDQGQRLLKGAQIRLIDV